MFENTSLEITNLCTSSNAAYRVKAISATPELILIEPSEGIVAPGKTFFVSISKVNNGLQSFCEVYAKDLFKLEVIATKTLLEP